MNYAEVVAAWERASGDPTPLNVSEAERLMNRATAAAWAGDPDAELPDMLRVVHPGPVLHRLRAAGALLAGRNESGHLA